MPRQERSYKTSAIIIKRRDFGEADRLLTVITPAHGKFDAIAKGARKLTSTKTGHVELFTRANMLIHRGRDLDIAAQVEMMNPFLPLREDLQRGAYANYVAELLDRFTITGEDDFHMLFTLLDTTFDTLCSADDPRLVVRYYELHLLDAVGFRPELNECVFTREAIQAEDQFFSYAEGGVVSLQGAKHGSSLIPVTMLTLKLLRYMQRSPYAHVASLNIPPQLHTEVERLMLGYITFLLERRLQSVDFIRRIRTTA